MSGQLREVLWGPGAGVSERGHLPRRGVYVLLAMVTLILGLNWPVMAVGVESISPVWMGVFRVGGGLLVVGTLSLVTGNLRVPPRPDLPIVLSLAVFRLAAVFVLVYSGLQLVPAGRSSVIVWTTSLWTVPIAAVFLGERMTGRRWVGLALGICGVVVLFEPWGVAWDQPGVALGHVLLITAAVVNAATAVHIRGHRWTVEPLRAVPWQLGGAFVILLAVSLVTEGPPVIDWSPSLALVVGYQGLLATGVAFWAQIVILRNLDAVSTNLTLMTVPVVGVVSSAVFLGERIDLTLLIGLVLVIVGVSVNLLSEATTRAAPGRAQSASGT